MPRGRHLARGGTFLIVRTDRGPAVDLKENKKYDQVFGAIGRGNSDPKLCEFPRETTPNAHALADEFVLLDNYFCSGVVSCDGHQGATQGMTAPVREKDWNNTHIVYNFGLSPLAYFSGPDRIDEHAELFSRWLWSTVRGDEPFPIEFFGPHGRGLKDLGLGLAPRGAEEDDDA